MTTTLSQPIRPQVRTIDGLSIRYAESEPRDDHALLLSPWPESIYCYEPTWRRLSEHTHLVAIDLPGFGQSERRNSLLSPKAMGEFVVRVSDTFGLEHPHVVGPDVGTGAPLFAAALYPGRFRSLAVGTGAAAFPLRFGGVLKEWVEAPSLEPYLTIDGRQIVTAAMATLERHKLTDTARQDYLASYAGERFAHQWRERSSGAAGQRWVSPRAAAQEQARYHHRCRTLHLGGRGRCLRGAGHHWWTEGYNNAGFAAKSREAPAQSG